MNELIKGSLLFFSIGLLYLFFTLFIEYFLWLKPVYRAVLFIVFILVESFLLLKFILIPLFKIWGLKKGIDEFQASTIIGNHFPEVSDKLLNMLQLKNIQENSELIEASIQQKSLELQPIPFKTAIDFTKNSKYLKYALIPILIWALIKFTGNISVFNDSFNRVVHYSNEFEPEAPFHFQILNNKLEVIKGEDFILEIITNGNVVPENVKVYFLNEFYYLEEPQLGSFNYTFTNVQQPLNFYLEAEGITSKVYQLNVIETPIITSLKLVLKYPAYTGKKNDIIQNTGNVIMPEGTQINWQVETQQANNVTLNFNKEIVNLNKVTDNYFVFSKQILNSLNYQLNTSNNQLQNFETLQFSIQVIDDEFPKIVVQSDIDSITRAPIQFMGQISDDYGIKKLQLVYVDSDNPSNIKTHLIEVPKSIISDFYYVFPDGIEIDEGVNYEFYFEVFDNDAVNGSKKTKSKTFTFYNKTASELNEDLLKEQKETLKEISESLEKSIEENHKLEDFQDDLQKKVEINWNDTKELETFIKRQQQYQQLFKKQTSQLQENLNNQPANSNEIKEKLELQKRINELQKLAEQDEMLKELNELTEKLSKEDLVEKLKKLTKENKYNQQSLERILELTKRFYVEQKINQISDKLSNLSEDQNELYKNNEQANELEKQEGLNNDFNKIKEEIKELERQNKDLKRPMKIPNTKESTEEISTEMQNAKEAISKENEESAKKSQKNASKKMKQLSNQLTQSVQVSNGEMLDENIEDLRVIVENLIEFSFQEEDLMEQFLNMDNNRANFPKNLKEQYVLKEYFEHIDDSIYMLSLRLVTLGSDIQKEVLNVHYNIDESLKNLTEDQLDKGISNQRFVITSANILANKLSDLLESLMNASPNMGSGSGNEQQFLLPDIIKKQDELSEEIQEGLKSKQQNSSEDSDEQMNGELYEIYKQQAELKNALEELLKNSNLKNSENASEVVKQMEELELELLENGISNSVLEKIKKLQYELLKLDEAEQMQGEKDDRKSNTNTQTFSKTPIEKLKFQNDYYNSNEILKRQLLPLQSIYKIKVQEYFKTEQ